MYNYVVYTGIYLQYNRGKQITNEQIINELSYQYDSYKSKGKHVKSVFVCQSRE